MKAFRIGRKPDGPWVNMTPPIRGGIYRKANDAQALDDELGYSDTDEDGNGADTTDDQSTSSSLSSDFSNALKTLTQRRVHGGGEPPAPKDAAPCMPLSPTAYTEQLMQQEVNECISKYPSLSPLVQQDIVAKYRALHQKIRDDGLYDCPFVEYAKEMARYTVLFTAFIVTLRYGWYMTSAAFLGLFWHQIMFSAHDAGRKWPPPLLRPVLRTWRSTGPPAVLLQPIATPMR
jgi:sphingolipid 8-(E)-desaturase